MTPAHNPPFGFQTVSQLQMVTSRLEIALRHRSTGNVWVTERVNNHPQVHQNHTARAGEKKKKKKILIMRKVHSMMHAGKKRAEQKQTHLVRYWLCGAGSFKQFNYRESLCNTKLICFSFSTTSSVNVLWRLGAAVAAQSRTCVFAQLSRLGIISSQDPSLPDAHRPFVFSAHPPARPRRTRFGCWPASSVGDAS